MGFQGSRFQDPGVGGLGLWSLGLLCGGSEFEGLLEALALRCEGLGQ